MAIMSSMILLGSPSMSEAGWRVRLTEVKLNLAGWNQHRQGIHTSLSIPCVCASILKSTRSVNISGVVFTADGEGSLR